MSTYPCASCGEPYEQLKRRATPYCADCRKARHKGRQRDAMRAARARQVKDNVVDVLNDYTRQGMDVDYVDMMRGRVDDYLDEFIPHEEGMHPEPPLTGANTPAGPEDGISTYFTDLADELDAHHRTVADHEWWTQNPNWWVGMHDDAPIPDTARLSAA